MADRYPPVNPRFPHFLHGGDYNPDQWAATPEVWAEDMRLMREAGCNAMSVGIFSWVSLEPAEGRYDFGWLDRIMDMLAEAGAYAVLATPSGARPAWLSAAYPEVLRVRADRVRMMHGGRHNHCFTSPVYREKVRAINTRLAGRYKEHPALLVWHVSNEYGGDCHCPLCQDAFRAWLRQRYGGDLGRLNEAWWTRFWSHSFTAWEQIESPGPIGEGSIHGLNLDWKRFVTAQTADFFRAEIEPLKRLTPAVPVTTNFMGTYPGLDYRKLAPHADVVSWDSYPAYHDRPGDWRIAASVSFTHDLNRCLKGGRPFMLMECTPSVTNWKPVNKLKRPGVLRAEALQAVAHGSDTVQYFQWRKGRGGSEKFHGAVVGHSGRSDTRVFREVAGVGRMLARLDPVVGTTVRPEVAVVYDWENRWAIEDAAGPRRERKDYVETCANHYQPFWSAGVPVDVIGADDDLSRYRLVVAPMLYMVRPGTAERLESFVAAGGTAVFTYLSGVADESDRCFLGGFPGPLRRMAGIWAEEIDVLYDDESVPVRALEGNECGLSGEYRAEVFCEIVHAETARPLAVYGGEFYAGSPAAAVNRFGRGAVYYVASRNDERFQRDLLGGLIRSLGLRRVLDTDLPEGVTAQMRTDGEREFVFVINFTREPRDVLLPGRFADCEDGAEVSGTLRLDGYGARALERTAPR